MSLGADMPSVFGGIPARRDRDGATYSSTHIGHGVPRPITDRNVCATKICMVNRVERGLA